MPADDTENTDIRTFGEKLRDDYGACPTCGDPGCVGYCDPDVLYPMTQEEMIDLDAEYEERFAAETERFQFRGEHKCDGEIPF